MPYQVVAPLVITKKQDGSDLYLYHRAFLPDFASEDEVKRLLDEKFIEKVGADEAPDGDASKVGADEAPDGDASKVGADEAPDGDASKAKAPAKKQGPSAPSN